MIHEEIARLVGRDDPTFLDIGCNDGVDTRRFLELFGPDARAHCFEPDPRAQRHFEAVTNDPRASLYKMAIGSVDGTAQFWPSNGVPIPDWSRLRPEGWDMSGSLRRPKGHLQAHPWCSFGDPITIEVHRLDTWAIHTEVDLIDFIWADVQGAEVDLIEGGRDTLRRTRFLYTEYNDAELYEGQVPLASLLQMLPGFEIVARYPDDVLLINSNHFGVYP